MWDTDGDGKDDAKDNNGDLIPDEWDTDGDGKPDSWDTDVPPDGNADSFDRDGNNKLDEDEDNSKHPELEGKDETGGRDTNGDGKADTWNEDENGNKAWDNDGDGKPDAWDTDGDGNADSFDRDGNNELDDNEDNSKHSDTLHGRDENGGKDNNGDGKPDSWDITGDDKDDSWDTDGDGNADSWDRNKNNTLDNNEDNSKYPELNGRDENGGRDTNQDGRPDTWDRDGDGKDDAWDTDVPPDGNADSFDKNGNGKLDDDEDNSKHSEELNGRDENGGKDTNGDGKSDTWDRDGDGRDDAKDTDGDGNADSFDKDHNGEIDESEDNSKHPDELKGRDENNGKDTNQDGKPDTWDRDGDGRDDAWDTDVPPDGNADSYDRNNNGRLDDNENNSLHPDELKGRDENGGKDTNQDGKPDTWDTNGDGKDDAWDITDDEGNKNPDGNADSYDRDGDGELDDNEDNSKHSEDLKGRDENHGKDTNGDGKPDLWDRDDNGEDDSQDTDKDGNADKWLDPDTKGWKDEDESGYRAWDTNKDGKPDSWDTNKDGDADSYDKNGNNKLDPDENSTTNPSEENNGRDKNGGRDTNGDGKPDAWDTNGDGKDDSWDTDVPPDGNADSYDKDKDNNLDDDENNSLHTDTLKGRDENGGKDTNGDGKPDTWDTNGDGKDDSWDTSDEDGNPTPDGKADSYDKNGNGILDDDENNSKHPDELKGRDQNGGKDTNGDGRPDTWDRDGDGRDDSWDKDGDGNADTYDRNWNGELEDSEDNSKHPEELKGRDENGGRDTNKDGRPDSWDTDGDNKDDAWDTDGDGDPDAWDTDEPKDGNADEWVFPSEEGTITFTYKPETWTNTPVEITLESDYTPEFSIEYSKNYNPVTRQGSWEAGTKTSLDENGKIYAHLKDDETGETGGVVRGEVNYIDKTNPTVETKTSDITTNSATLNVTASDAQSGLAKEDTYKYYLIEGEVSDLEQVNAQKGSAKETSTNSSYKFTKLKENEKYTLVVDVSDEVGNVTTDFKTVQITKIPDLDQAEITFDYSNNNWNNDQSVHVTISMGEGVDTKNYDLQYQTPNEENSDWQNYTDAGFDITKNGNIYVRLKEKDGDQGGKTATSTYSKFDRDDPTVSLEVGNRTTTSIQVTATGSDGEGSGIQKYEFYQGEEVKHTETTSDASASYTYDSLTPGEAYSLKVVITDNVGRTGEDTANADETKTIPDLNQEGSINFEYTPTDGNWTNDKVNVKVTSKYTDQGYKIEYSTEEPENWQDYTEEGFNVEEENGKFKVRLKQQTGELTTDAIEKEITWIDKTAPKLEITGEPQVSTNSIAVEVTASDELSKLKAGTPISYYLIEGEVADADQIQAQKGVAKESSIATSYTYTNLTQGKAYTIVIEATDNANNTTTVSRVLTTGNVPGLDQAGDLTVTYSNTEWNNQDSVKVTLVPKTPVADAFKLEYKVDYTSPRPETDTNVPWTEYGDGFDITNNATITARITEKEGTQSGTTATSTYSKFDREEPELSEISVTDTTTNSISVEVSATDKPDDNPSGLVEENTYTYMIDTTENMSKIDSGVMVMGEPMGASDTLVTESSNEPTHTFTGLTHGTDYTIKVMVMDKAQNMAEQEKTQTTEKIPDLSQAGAITFDITPESWNNKDQATVRLNSTETIDEAKFKLQYQTPNEENKEWQDYDKELGFTIKNNGSIFARLIEKEGKQTGTSATYNYNFFDRKLPEITIQAGEPTVEDVKVNITDSKDDPSSPDAKDASGLLDENKYTYYIEEVGGSTGEIAAHIGNETSFTYGSLLQGKQYKVRVTATDKAGNIGTSTTETITAQTIPDLNDADSIKTQYTPSRWTNAESVKVTLTSKYTEQGYIIQYSTDYKEDTPGSATWRNYETNGFNITDNQKFGVRLKLESKYGQAAQYGKVKVEQVTWIDRVPPELEITGDPTKTTNSITVNVTASDALSQLKDDNPIKYYLLDGSVTDPEQIKTQKAEAENQTATSEISHQFTGLTQDKTYTVVVDAEDKAGNIATQSKVVTTVKVPDLNYGTDITYTYAPPSWTNTPPVTVTLNPQNNIDEGFTLQYGTSTTAEEPKDWNDYNSSPFGQNENCTIYTRLKETDGEQVGKSAQHEMKLIDTQEPTGTLKVSSYSANSLSVEVENAGDDLSGLHKTETYTYSIYEGSSAEGVEAKETKPASTETTAKFTDLTQGQEYTVKVAIKDIAGNTHEAVITKTLDKVPDLAEGDITFNYDTNTWTNKESVKVTLIAKDTVDLEKNKLQYSTNYNPDMQTGEWNDYPEGDTGFTITENGSIYARLIEREGTQTGGVATGNYSFFDRKAPTPELKVTGTTSTNTINVSAEGTIDEVGELADTPYVFSIYEGATAEGVEAKETKVAQAEEATSFTGLTHGTQYTIKVEVSDKATNKESKTVTETTVKIPDLNYGTDITYTYSPDTWTNSPPVNVTLNPQNNIDDGFTLQYGILSGETSYIDESTTIGNQSKSNYWENSVGEITDPNPLYSEETYFLASRWMNLADIGYCSWGLQAWSNGCLGLSTDLFGYWPDSFSNPRIAKYRVVVTLPSTARFDTAKSGESANEAISIIWSGSDGTSAQSASLEVGQYIDYIPEGKTTSYLSQSAYNGAYDQRLNREELHWRILSIDENVVKIISDVSSNSITYQGAAGYNNAVKDLNDMCEALYSHGTTMARSVNLEDFKGQPGVHQVSGEVFETPSLAVPAIWNQEIDGGGVLGQSESPRGDIKKLEWHDYNSAFPVQENGMIYARLKEKDGEQAGGSAQSEMKLIDTEAPTVNEITDEDIETTDISIKVTVHATDEKSGIKEYKYYLDGEAEDNLKATQPAQTENPNEDSYTFDGLDTNSTHTVIVKVIDKATNEGRVEKADVVVKTNLIGKYVKYIPDQADDYTSEQAHNGYQDQTISQETLNWRILDIGNGENGLDEGVVKIISDPTTTSVTYKGAEGYNNIVKDLNEMCKTLYSHGTTYARSVNLDDFTNKSQTYTAGQYSATCPTIYPQEKVAGGSLDQSQQNDWVTGSTTSTYKMGSNYWKESLQNTDPLYSSTTYFLASRCVEYYWAHPNYYFDVQSVKTSLSYSRLREYSFSATYYRSVENRVRAVVILPIDAVLDTESTNGRTPETAYNIKWPKKPSEMTDKIGDYVKYIPSGGSASYLSEEAHNGNGDQTIDRETLNWRILSVDGDSVKIISDPTTGTVTYKGAEGYNNAVKDLNDMCKTLYSHGTTYARSVNLDDFTSSQWSSSFSQTSGSASPRNNTFPKIYQSEYSGSLGQSQQTQWYSGTYTGSTAKNTYWSGRIPSDSPLYNLLSNSYWLSSRFSMAGKQDASFNLQYAYIELSYVNRLYASSASGGTDYEDDQHVRAVVSLPSDVTFGNEQGTIEDPYTINWNDGSGSESG